jgi:hypothetical protein
LEVTSLKEEFMVKKLMVLALLMILAAGSVAPAAFACGGDKSHGDKTEAVEE